MVRACIKNTDYLITVELIPLISSGEQIPIEGTRRYPQRDIGGLQELIHQLRDDEPRPVKITSCLTFPYHGIAKEALNDTFPRVVIG